MIGRPARARPGRRTAVSGVLLFGWFVCSILGAETNLVRNTTTLNGEWLFQRDQVPAGEWRQVQVPSTFQSHEGTNFHGVGWYRRLIAPVNVPPGKRVLLSFQAAATETEVQWDGKKLGTHLGGWTPFRFDITELIKQGQPGRTHELLVRVDEKVGHNTQGFLPIIEPHFGGLWQDVSLLTVPETYINELELLAIGEPATGQLHLEVSLAGTAPASITNVAVVCRLRDQGQWTELVPSVQLAANKLSIRAPVAAARLWSPADPNLYDVEIRLLGNGTDRVRTRAAFRSMETFGSQFRLNGQPLSIRGLLNWGYSAPLLEPNPGETVWRSELKFARTSGFNLMKFCLWVPPQRYLDLCDEMGMLAWMEYPTWHPNFTGRFLEPLRREFREFFIYDRNHPAIVLRSLTCETGPSAELGVIQSLYQEAHELIPGALVEDDSSWIGWNRVHDFYDDHPYGNNHTWVKTLEGYNDYILGHGLKPIVLGEATAADTWLDGQAMETRLAHARPWWTPNALDDTGRWLERMRGLVGPKGLEELRPESLRYALLMRKYQIETFRRELPYGGYVISVIRDFPSASMGLLDYFGHPKWSSAEWAWQQDTVCLLKTEGDRRSFMSGERLLGQVLLSHFGITAIQGGRLTCTLNDLETPDGAPLASREKADIAQNPGTLASLTEIDWAAPEAAKPRHLAIRAELKTAQAEFRNEWPIWVVPAPPTNWLRDVRVHNSLLAAWKNELFPGCAQFDESQDGIAAASHFDEPLARFLEKGGRVLLLPDGQPFSLPTSAHWFLRGGPYIPESALDRQVPRELLVELQHFDLASDVVPNLPHLESIDPILLLWDTHDQKAVKTHGVIFETRIGKGRMLVSAAKHAGSRNAAGRWLLSVALEQLRSPQGPRHTLPAEVWGYAKARMHADQTNLVARVWKFKPDPGAQGLTEGWHAPGLASEANWKDIRIGNWWELQGYPELDGWAWYRLWVDVPTAWRDRKVYLSFEGVDDMYELYVNGAVVGKVGDLATRKDALNEQTSHDITRFVHPGQKALIAVRVYDWFGYGGIFRPVTLGTLPFRPEMDFLK